MFCAECGVENPDDAGFCGECGQSLKVSEFKTKPEPDVITRVVDLDHTGTSVSNGLKYGVVVASFFIPLIGVIMGLIYMVKEEDENKKAVGRLWLYVGLGFAFLYLVGGSSYY